jgi:hypothetical protein
VHLLLQARALSGVMEAQLCTHYQSCLGAAFRAVCLAHDLVLCLLPTRFQLPKCGFAAQVANRVCHGRVVSILEGGYRTQGQIVSAFSRSVAAHVHALAEQNSERWDAEAAQLERQQEWQLRQAKLLLRRRRAESRAAGRMSGELEALRAEAQEAARGGIEGVEPAGDGEGGGEGSAAEGEDRARVSKRRRGGAVDYVALNRKLEEQGAGSQGMG